VPDGLTNVVSVAAGWYHSLALKPDHQVVAWGDNSAGQTNVPATLTNAIAVTAGWLHSLALRVDGTIVGWGDNGYGQGGGPPYAGACAFVAISASMNHNLALRGDGKVVAWGDDSLGQCDVPLDLKASVGVAAGWSHSLSLAVDGTVRAWGDNSLGQCALPAGLTNGATVTTAVAAGAYHSLALLADGTVQAWGDNGSNQCLVPADLTNAVAIAAGLDYSLALRADGTVEGWGGNGSNQITRPSALPRVTALAANCYQSMAVSNPVAPSIIFSSPNQTSAIGFAVSLYVLATGSPPLAYQWYSNNVPIADGTNNVLRLFGASVAQAGVNDYVAVARNTAGFDTNSPILLSLQPGLAVQLCPAITLYGETNKAYLLQSTPVFGPPGPWNTVAAVTLTNSPQIYFDLSAIGRPQMFYQLVGPTNN